MKKIFSYTFFLSFVFFIAGCASSSSKQLVKMDSSAGIIVWSYVPGSNMIGFDEYKYWLLNDDICKRMGFVGYVFEANFTNVGLYRNTEYEVCVTAAEINAYDGKLEAGLLHFEKPFQLYQRAVNYAGNRRMEVDSAVQSLNILNSSIQHQTNSYSQPSQVGRGFLKSESISGINKICFYDRLGSGYAITIKATQLCPLRQ